MRISASVKKDHYWSFPRKVYTKVIMYPFLGSNLEISR